MIYCLINVWLVKPVRSLPLYDCSTHRLRCLSSFVSVIASSRVMKRSPDWANRNCQSSGVPPCQAPTVPVTSTNVIWSNADCRVRTILASIRATRVAWSPCVRRRCPRASMLWYPSRVRLLVQLVSAPLSTPVSVSGRIVPRTGIVWSSATARGWKIRSSWCIAEVHCRRWPHVDPPCRWSSAARRSRYRWARRPCDSSSSYVWSTSTRTVWITPRVRKAATFSSMVPASVVSAAVRYAHLFTRYLPAPAVHGTSRVRSVTVCGYTSRHIPSVISLVTARTTTRPPDSWPRTSPRRQCARLNSSSGTARRIRVSQWPHCAMTHPNCAPMRLFGMLLGAPDRVPRRRATWRPRRAWRCAWKLFWVPLFIRLTSTWVYSSIYRMLYLYWKKSRHTIAWWNHVIKTCQLRNYSKNQYIILKLN